MKPRAGLLLTLLVLAEAAAQQTAIKRPSACPTWLPTADATAARQCPPCPSPAPCPSPSPRPPPSPCPSPSPSPSPSSSPSPSPSPAPAATCNCTDPAGPSPAPCSSPDPDTGGPSPRPGWTLLWRDEFEGKSLDTSKWGVQIARGCQYGALNDLCGWGNSEMQFYAERPQNLRVEGGNLWITAMHEYTPTLFSQSSGADAHFTSARIRTFRKYAVRPTAEYPTVRVEARIQVPSGIGLWPAFWMLPEEGANAGCSGCGKYGVWATSGEIDIAEWRNGMDEVLGTIHYGSNWPNNKYITHTRPAAPPLSAAFHTYAIEWEATSIRWYLDDQLFGTSVSGNGAQSDGAWYSAGAGAGPNSPFDVPFHIILNLAIGSPYTPFTGKAFGVADVQAALATPQSMKVDYVRVYGKPATGG